MINLLIAGYHGFGNSGDEATLLAMTTNIKKMTPDVSITALSFDPEFTKTEYGIHAVQRFNLYQLLRAIYKSDIVVSGGGTLLQDGTSTRSLLYYLGIIKTAKLLGKKVMLYSNGIGPVSGKFNRRLIKWVINLVDLITLREQSSEKDLRTIGVNKPNIYITADPAFTLTPAPDEVVQPLLQEKGIVQDGEHKIVGVSIREWNGSREPSDKYVKTIAAVCDKLAREGKQIVVIPMQYPRDLDISVKLRDAMKEKSYVLDRAYSPAEMVGIISKMDLMISMRLHSLIFAAITHIPMLGIVYDPKVENYLKVLRMPSAGDIRSDILDSDKMIAQVEEILENYGDYVEILEQAVTALVRKSHENDKHLKTLIDTLR